MHRTKVREMLPFVKMRQPTLGWMRQQDLLNPSPPLSHSILPILPGGWSGLFIPTSWLWHLRLRKVTGLAWGHTAGESEGKMEGKVGLAGCSPQKESQRWDSPGVQALTPGLLSLVCGYITAYWTPPSGCTAGNSMCSNTKIRAVIFQSHSWTCMHWNLSPHLTDF